MNKMEAEAYDALVAYEVRLRKAPIGYGPRPASKPSGTWAPKMTEQQKQTLDQYVRDNNLPF
jgi:hypothetical protein